MKIVREHINEKFKEESDPIRDMGIGSSAHFNNELKKLREFSNSVVDIYDNIFNKDGEYDSFNEYGYHGQKMKVITVRLVYHTINDKFVSKRKSKNSIEDVFIKTFRDEMRDQETIYNSEKREIIDTALDILEYYYDIDINGKKIFEELDDELIITNESLNEKFEEESDPIHDLGIGKYEIDFLKYAAPVINKYHKQEKNNTYLGTYAKRKKYFNEFIDKVNPLIEDMYLKSKVFGVKIWEIGKSWTKPDAIIHIKRIPPQGGKYFFDKDKIFNMFNVESMDGKKYTLFFSFAPKYKQTYIIATKPKLLK